MAEWVFRCRHAWRLLEHDPATCDQPPDQHARQNKALERDATVNADSTASHSALGKEGVLF
jgi:hypothetical protein